MRSCSFSWKAPGRESGRAASVVSDWVSIEGFEGTGAEAGAEAGAEGLPSIAILRTGRAAEVTMVTKMERERSFIVTAVGEL